MLELRRRSRRRWWLGVLLAFSAAVCVGMVPSAALAGKGVGVVVGIAGTGDGQFSGGAGSLAVSGSTGDTYVLDPGADRVEQFDADGNFLQTWGWGVATGAAGFETCMSGCLSGSAGSGDGQFSGPSGIAIDQSDGSVYVVDANNSRVEKFDASGSYLSQFGTAGSAEGQFSGPQGIAVDPTDHSVYVVDSNNNRVQNFSGAGAFVRMFGFGVADGNSAFETCMSSCQPGIATGDSGSLSFPTRVAVDSTGRVYVLDSGNGRIERYAPATNAFDEVFDPADVFLPQEIAIGAGGHLYVAQWAQDFSEQHVVEIDGSGSVVDTHGIGSTANNSSGLGVNADASRIYLADGGNSRVFILEDVTAPVVTINPPASVTSTSASLSGTVNPEGNPNMGWHFESSTDDANWTPVAADQDPGSGTSPFPVGQNLTGLVSNTTFFVRLVAKRTFNASVISSEVQFTTVAIAPTVTTDVADDITPDHAVLTGRVNPNHSPTTYYFQYGPTTSYGTSIPATQDADAGSANQVAAVLGRIDGLQAGTTYHYRLVATNQAATTNGQDQTFTTGTQPSPSTARAGIPGAGLLPDNRGYEKISPDDKNGADIMGDSGRTGITADGSAANFSSLAAFGDAIGTSIATDYLSVRGANGWAAHAVTPQQKPTTITAVTRNLQSAYDGFSGDLSKGVFLAWSPVTDDPNVANVANLYVRDDVRTPGAGAYQLLSVCPLCASTSTPLPPLLGNIPGGGLPRFAGASVDFGHVIFESQQPLTGDAPGNCSGLSNLRQCPGKLYEWDHGTLRLAGVLPDGTSAFGSQAGQGAGSFQHVTELTPHTISADGGRIFFTVPDRPGSTAGVLYMRVHHSTTAQLNASARTDCADHDPCSGAPEPDPGGPQAATYRDASTDGSRVFFTTTEALTDDAPLDGNNKLYVYDASMPASDPHHLKLVSQSADPSHIGGVVNVQGVSADGHYAYFAATGQFVPGQPLLGSDTGLYAWHDGTIRYIASMGDFTDNIEDTNTNSWSFTQPTARVTPDGLHLLFSSTLPTGPTGYDQGHCGALSTGCRELYVYSYESQRLACASCNPSGAPATANASIAQRVGTSASVTSPAQNHPLSSDGRHVFFTTGEALVPQDVSGRLDVYEYDEPTGTVHLITSGTDRSDSYFMDASPSGSDVLFLTRAQLVGRDSDSNYDLYDARVSGGFPEPPPPRSGCTGEACRAPQSQMPGVPSVGSGLIAGTSGSPPVKAKHRPKRCRKGYLRKKVHGRSTCLKKPRVRHARKATKAKRARSQRRAK